MTSLTQRMRGNGAHPSASPVGSAARRLRSLPFFDLDGAPGRLLLVLTALGGLAGLPLGLYGLLLGAFGGFALGLMLAGVLTVVATLARPHSQGD